jgi:hypothetical protein
MTSERSDVIGIELGVYEFLIVFHSKYAPIVHGLSANVTFSPSDVTMTSLVNAIISLKSNKTSIE